MLRVGQRVTCVDDNRRFIGVDILPNFVVKNKIYTIRALKTHPCIPGYGVLLLEVLNPTAHPNADISDEWAFDAGRFRPVEARKTDISIFKQLLLNATANQIGFLQ